MTNGTEPERDAPSFPVATPAAAPPVRPRRRPSWTGLVALLLVLGLGGLAAYQGVQLDRVTDRLDGTEQRLADLAGAQTSGAERTDELEARTATVEEAVAGRFDPEEIAQDVLPSVFKVVAGDFTGTAFAVAGTADGGGTDLFTNFHVVEQVWQRGGRQVFLEQADRELDAEIVDVDPDRDVAWLRTSAGVARLAPAPGWLRAGQPIVSVGAPLGLSDSVTTGVVSNTDRQLPDGSGPWIQFDAAVEPGNSGGPVINAEGQVVGIATRKATDFGGIGFALPITDACQLFDVCAGS